MPTLTGPRAAPRSGQTKSLVILLHGYGADGNDLFGLSGPLAQNMPDTAFRSPNAPERCPVNPMGYQWFPIPWIDGSSESEMEESFVSSAEGRPSRSAGSTPSRSAFMVSYTAW